MKIDNARVSAQALADHYQRNYCIWRVDTIYVVLPARSPDPVGHIFVELIRPAKKEVTHEH